MSSYEKYNQAISEEKQIQQIEKDIRPQVEQQLQEVQSSETSYNKALRQAVISNQNVDLRQASESKKQFAVIKSQVSEPLRQIEQEKQRIASEKASAVKTFEQLEAQGYSKEVRGDVIIYYKEDTYNRSKGDKRTYRKEEYKFKSDGTPITIIKRDDYSDNGKRKVDEEEKVTFDQQGRVSQVRTWRDGQKDESVSYSFESDGSMTVKTRDYAKERKLQEKAQKEYEKQLAEDRKMKNITASVDIYGNSEYTETKYNEKTGQWEKTTTTYTKQAPNISKSKTTQTKVLQATKTPITPEAFKISSLTDIGLTPGIPGVNQGTDTSNIPKTTIKSAQQIAIEKQLSDTSGLSFQSPESVRVVQTQTSTPEQIKAVTDVKATAITGKEVVFGFERPGEDQVNLNPARILTAPYQLGTEIGSYLAENVKGERSIVEDTKKVVSKVTTDPLGTGKSIVVGTVQGLATDPFGFVGETLAFEGAGRLASSGTRTVASKIRPATITESPATIRTQLVDDVIQTETRGAFAIEQGLIRRTSQDFTFESTGQLERVKSFETPGTKPGDELKTISETKTQRISDKPTPEQPKQIPKSSTSRDLAVPNVEAKIGGAPIDETVSIASVPIEREVFRGEITTVVKDTKGEVVKTQKVPAELVREGQKQTLFVDGKPFDIKQTMIDTPKGYAIEGGLAMEEGAYGLSPKRQTIQTTATDLETGSQRVALTQQIVDDTKDLFSGAGGDFSRPQRQIAQERQNLLSDKPQTPGEFVQTKGETVQSTIGKDLIERETRAKKGRSSKTKGEPGIDIKEFEGISMKAEPQKVSISKPEETIIDTTATERIDLMNIRQLEDKSQRQIESPGTIAQRDLETRISRPKLETGAMREERQVVEIFGQDPFASGDMFKTTGGGQFEQVFAETTQTSKQTTKSVVEPQKPQTPSSKGSTQEIIFEEPVVETKTRKEIKVEQEVPVIDASLGVDFSGVATTSTRFGVIPGFRFDQGDMFAQSPGVATAQEIAQGVAQDTGTKQDVAFDQGFKQDTVVETITKTDVGFKQDFRQETSQKEIQDTTFDVAIVPPVIPGFDGGGGEKPRKQKDMQSIPDPFSKTGKRPKKHEGEYAGSLTALVQGIEVGKIDKKMKVTGFEKRAILKGRGF